MYGPAEPDAYGAAAPKVAVDRSAGDGAAFAGVLPPEVGLDAAVSDPDVPAAVLARTLDATPAR